ncbi:MAG TPA: hypothetical protein VFI13_11170, partial [Gemmatimonadales bacterium]|nr:hypothetical protein [Gemmatimonadales bacterium]
ALILVFALGIQFGKRSAQLPEAPEGGAPAAAAPFAGGAATGTPPDISNMSPRERFDRLFDRVMRSASSGDMNSVQTFAPMALQAYAMLDTVDADARFDAATIDLHIGDVAGATALADTLVKEHPAHLFGWMLKATVARFQQDTAATRAATAQFTRHYEAEMKARRPEYTTHQQAIATFRRQAGLAP